MRDPYAVLGVARSASNAEVKIAYHRLAMKFHPDNNPGNVAAENLLKEINVAYEAITDPSRNQRGRAPDPPPSPTPRHQPGPRTANISATVTVSLEDVLHGCHRQILYSRGNRNGDIDICLVNIGPGIQDGSVIVVPRAGYVVSGPYDPGDMLVTVQYRPHHRFEPNTIEPGSLLIDAWLTADEMTMGWYVEVKDIDGKTVRVRVPPGTQPQQLLRVRGRGLIDWNTGLRGHMYVRVRQRAKIDAL